MRGTMRVRASILASLLGLSVPALSQTLPLDLTVGYRFLSLSGSEEMYRSQVNERSGLLLRSLSLTTSDLSGSIVDAVRVEAADLGAGPSGMFRFQAGRAGLYDLKFNYRRTEHFDSVPTFPLQTSDRTRNSFDVELTALPGKVISPIVGYSRSRYEGPGTTTYSVGGNEFRLRSDLDDTEQEFRVGAAFDAGPVTGQVIQGWRKTTSTETNTLIPGAGTGVNPGTYLELHPTLNDLTRVTNSDANTPVTNAVVVGRFSRIKLIGSYVRANGEGDTESAESLTGNLLSYPISRFFTGLSETVSSRAKNKMWKGEGRLEVNVVEGVDVSAGYTRRHKELDGIALLNSLYTGTVAFVGKDTKDVLSIVNAQTALERTEDVYEVAASARALGPVSLRVGWSQADQDLTVTQDPYEIVVPGHQGGSFERSVRRIEGAASVNHKGVMFNAEYRHETADQAVLRTDFTKRDRLRLRLSYTLGDTLRLGLHVTGVNQTNDGVGNDLDGRSRTWGADVEASPWKGLRLRLGANRFTNDSSLSILQPYDYSLGSSIHEERGTDLSGGVSYTLDPATFSLGVSRFENKGFYPFDIDRARLSVEVGFAKQLGVVGEWGFDSYHEPNRGSASYDANRYGIYLRWHPID